MKQLIEDIAKEAGFVFWGEEEIGDGIDWSCDYTKELENLVELIVAECVDAVEESDTHHAYTSFTVSIADASKAKAVKAIKDRFYGKN
jgi:hypothetical protein